MSSQGQQGQKSPQQQNMAGRGSAPPSYFGGQQQTQMQNPWAPPGAPPVAGGPGSFGGTMTQLPNAPGAGNYGGSVSGSGGFGQEGFQQSPGGAGSSMFAPAGVQGAYQSIRSQMPGQPPNQAGPTSYPIQNAGGAGLPMGAPGRTAHPSGGSGSGPGGTYTFQDQDYDRRQALGMNTPGWQPPEQVFNPGARADAQAGQRSQIDAWLAQRMGARTGPGMTTQARKPQDPMGLLYGDPRNGMNY
jgi:hypothetical protein